MGHERRGALHHALEMAARPGLAPIMRQRALPSDVLIVIRIAAGDDETLEAAGRWTGRQEGVLREAAAIYLQQALFTKDADAYRILGVAADAPQDLIGQHMRWLMKWLHPDRERSDWEAAFAQRISSAWDSLKTPQRRAQYDARLGINRASRATGRSGPAFRYPWIRNLPRTAGSIRYGRRLLFSLFAAAVLVALLFMPEGPARFFADDENVAATNDAAINAASAVAPAPPATSGP
jgi:hypothetical protein